MASVIDQPRAAEPAWEPQRIRLSDVSWDLYTRLRDIEANDHIRMSYFHGTLELMSPQFRHERSASRLDRLVMVVAEILRIPCVCSASTTFRSPGNGPRQGVGKEADTSFYFAHESAIRDKDDIDLSIDPPPDLAIEVDNTRESESKLPIYAELGVPEVWRFDARTGFLQFHKLLPDGSYPAIERSESLPMLTPELVIEALALCHGISDSEWLGDLRKWAERLA